MTQAELSAQVGVKTPGTVTALNSLERRKLVERRVDANDRRKTRIYLTPEGTALKRELMPIAQEVLTKALEGISREELRVFRSVLLRLRANSRSLT
jgi:DNA-binding MarR family transcriptional regulator